MALGRREVRRTDWRDRQGIRSTLNRVLAEAGFDRFVEERCKPYYAAGQGRPSIPTGVYFRMLMIGYFEGIDSQRGIGGDAPIAWR